MNTFKSYYFVWLLIILTSVLIGSIFISDFRETSKTEPETVTETESVTVEEPTPKISQKEAHINNIKNSLTVEQQIGQLILARVPETNQIEDIQKYALGGYLIFNKDVIGETSETFPQKIQSWQSASLVPMLIASDEEGGTVTRVSNIIPERFNAPGDIYRVGGFELLTTQEFIKAHILKNLGVNVNLAPVADVAVNPASFIYERTLELPIETNLIDAANLTAQYVTIVVNENNKVPIGSCLKHFPGYGENADSHSVMINDARTLDVLQTIDFIPFKAGIDAGAGSVLISHNICSSIDPTEPASLSPEVHSLLRDTLGFKGVIICDDLDMKGLSTYTDIPSAAVRTIMAGTDLIICSNYNEIIPRIKAGLDNGTISAQRFNEAVDHVLGWKYDLGLI